MANTISVLMMAGLRQRCAVICAPRLEKEARRSANGLMLILLAARGPECITLPLFLHLQDQSCGKGEADLDCVV